MMVEDGMTHLYSSRIIGNMRYDKIVLLKSLKLRMLSHNNNTPVSQFEWNPIQKRVKYNILELLWRFYFRLCTYNVVTDDFGRRCEDFQGKL